MRANVIGKRIDSGVPGQQGWKSPRKAREDGAEQRALRGYEQDYAAWIEDTARAIEDGRFDEIDRTALADEVRDLGIKQRARLESALRVLLIHLLKAAYQAEKKTRIWAATIRVQRSRLNKSLKQSPSLRRELPELLGYAYENARMDAANGTGIDLGTFPKTCEWALADVLG